MTGAPPAHEDDPSSRGDGSDVAASEADTGDGSTVEPTDARASSDGSQPGHAGEDSGEESRDGVSGADSTAHEDADRLEAENPQAGPEEGLGREEDDDDDDDGDSNDDDDDDDDSDEEEEEDEEPKLKYARLTQHLGPVYRNGDATSSFLVAGDKMV
jgi:hypothetical protein